MTRKVLLVACVLLATLVSAAPVDAAITIAPVPVTGKIKWVLNYAEGQKISRETGKPLFVVFRCER